MGCGDLRWQRSPVRPVIVPDILNMARITIFGNSFIAELLLIIGTENGPSARGNVNAKLQLDVSFVAEVEGGYVEVDQKTKPLIGQLYVPH